MCFLYVISPYSELTSESLFTDGINVVSPERTENVKDRELSGGLSRLVLSQERLQLLLLLT